EFAVPHASAVAAAAAGLITRGRYAPDFWGSVVGGLALPLLLIVIADGSTPVVALAGALSLAGLFFYEWAFVMAPQQVPNN
ncbi:MAG TPA: 4Fe-4S ferredoxin, partial [Thermoanaerobaculia bacterium]|nr:4Fe-4S ferredoxin [Thermoanaerobaculia bacterium]